MMAQPVSFVNAAIGARPAAAMRMVGTRIAALDALPRPGDIVVDAAGDRLLPGLINAHDHLQLNNFPRLKYREVHADVGEWIADIDARRTTDRAIAEPASLPRDARLLIGGVKNILSGVTTVAHHDRFDSVLEAAGFPCHVLREYGWSHSLGLDGEESVRASYLATPRRTPWFIHAGEGVSAAAADEFARLDRLGCLGPNTRLIHGVAFTTEQRTRLADAGAGLIWCPSSNFFLFGTTCDCSDLITRGRVAIGSDSRLSGARDLLEELCVAHERCAATPAMLETLATTCGASLLGLADRGRLAPSSLADCIVLPPQVPLGVARRADLRCVVLGGSMVWGEETYAEQLIPRERRVPATLDGRPKVFDLAFAEVLRRAPAHESGVRFEIPEDRAA